MNNLSEPSLWVIVVTLAGVVAFFGRYTMTKLTDCEDDREVLHKKTAKLAGAYSALTGKQIDLEHV